ncbi:hypothetical protein [Pajaroellobacter abortibovis]|uniref:Thiol:disulfide interchange protein DsbD N-terminal domain-containing protein n=1 Tax=Pajaroellobacter abortibovis TaxID=1882918 RepID=A0A1L6MWT1_9BACT|nr:hypothetical protein [Pajaroellobacter abortibovis]APS00011.1 hypothetical protein BCY86_04405 [Pajaroellobacter abortibovis]
MHQKLYWKVVSLSFGILGLLGLAQYLQNSTRTATSSPPRSSLPESPNPFLVKVIAPKDCKVASTPCTVIVRLDAQDPYHINANYPHKLKFKPSSQVQFLGLEEEGGEAVFSKEGEHFLNSDSTAEVKVTVQPIVSGHVLLEGTYFLSVCSTNRCISDKQQVQIELEVNS